jgi:hypothetical protein
LIQFPPCSETCPLPCSVSKFAQDQQILEDLRDIIQALRAQQASYTNRNNIHKLPLYFDSWRPIMVSWMYSVIDTFALNPLCVPTGLYYLDNCCHRLSNAPKLQKDGKELYPLMAMTALNVAVKCHETRMFPLDQLVQLLGRGKRCNSGQEQMRYTPQDVIDMERTLVQGCLWKLHPTTTHDFLHQFVQVLDVSSRNDVLARSMTHLKNALLWEHVLHQQHNQRQSFQPFLASTLAYASLLLAMEEMQVPLVDKQACCLALLQVADLSTHTPHLAKAYNWLVYAKNLQAQLVAGNQRQPTTNIPAALEPTAVPPTRVVSPTTTATVSTGHAVTAASKADFQPPQPLACQPSMAETSSVSQPLTSSTSFPVLVSPADSTATMEDVTATCTAHGSMVVEATTVSIKANAVQIQQHFRHPSDEVDRVEDRCFQEESYDHHYHQQDDAEENKDDDDDLSEVIFYSHTYTGDGFEVMAIDMESGEDSDKHDADHMDHPPPPTRANARSDTTPLTSPASTEHSRTDLILTDSLDEDGFEVSYAGEDGKITNDMQSYSSLGKMLVSPTDVNVA